MLLTVKDGEDFLHHLPQDEDVRLGLRRGSGFAEVAVLARPAEVAVLLFGLVGVRCRAHVLQTRRPCGQIRRKEKLTSVLSKLTLHLPPTLPRAVASMANKAAKQLRISKEVPKQVCSHLGDAPDLTCCHIGALSLQQ